LDLASVRRYSRQIALPELGVDGQERLLAAEVALVGSGMALETAARYLSGAGVQRFRLLGADGPLPDGGEAWVTALDGVTLVLRAGFDDDPMLRAAVRLGVPVVVMRASAAGLDVISFRHHGPCPHAALDIPARASDDLEDPGLAVVAGTLAASEALWRIACPAEAPRARHLRLPPDGEPLAQEIPWAPECFACGGQAREAVPS
jgi:hypothetical protein